MILTTLIKVVVVDLTTGQEVEITIKTSKVLNLPLLEKRKLSQRNITNRLHHPPLIPMVVLGNEGIRRELMKGRR